MWVVIPTIGYSKLLISLIKDLQQDKLIDKIILTVNQKEYVDQIKKIIGFDNPAIEIVETWLMGKSIHHGWNAAIEMARRENALLAILNDDIRIMRYDSISIVARILSDNPSYALIGLNWQTPDNADDVDRELRQVHGSYRHGGVGGWAWVCDPHKIVLVPDGLVWWYGDDHIFFSAEQDGHHIGIANNIYVEHINEHTANSGDQNWTHDSKEKDYKKFQRLWPGQ